MRSIAERRTSLTDRFASWVPHTLDSWLDLCVEQYADREFVVTDDRCLTYAEVAQESRVLADGLAALGVRAGDRVGLLMANHAEFVTLKFAIARTGAVAIPFNFLYRAEELGYVLAQSGCSVLVTMAGFGGLDHAGMVAEVAPPSLRHVVVTPHGGPADSELTLADLHDLGRAHPGAAAATHEPTDICDMLYTSGSTGSPKGVQVTHDAVLRTAYASALTRAHEDGRRILFSLPCYHMFGYVEGLLSAMYVGGAVIMLPAFSAEAYLTAVETHRATDLLCVPTMAVALVESPLRHEVDLSSLTAILCGSAPAPLWLWEQVQRDFGVSEIVTGYGMTECGGAMTLTLPEDDLTLTSTTVGRPKLAGVAGVPGTATAPAPLCVYRAVNPETGEALPDGEVGELVSFGPTTMLGYYAKPEETASALRADATGQVMLHSGDLGRVRPDGYLELTGRSKELYKSGGELVMPKEIEDVLAAHPGISQVYAVGVVDDRWGEIGCAVVVPAPGASLSADDVIAYAKAHLARFKVPKRVVFLDATDLPATATGKVQKFRLVELVSAQPTQNPAQQGEGA
jgi:fatty-acyl-CoA synthase